MCNGKQVLRLLEFIADVRCANLIMKIKLPTFPTAIKPVHRQVTNFTEKKLKLTIFYLIFHGVNNILCRMFRFIYALNE